MSKCIAKILLLLGFNIFSHKINCLPIEPRLSIADYTSYNHFEPEGPGTYAFGYDIDDPETGNVQFRDEERFPNGTIRGKYGYVMPDGNVHLVRYEADENGYRAFIEDPAANFRENKVGNLDDNYLKNEELLNEINESESLPTDINSVNPHRFFILQNNQLNDKKVNNR